MNKHTFRENNLFSFLSPFLSVGEDNYKGLLQKYFFWWVKKRKMKLLICSGAGRLGYF